LVIACFFLPFITITPSCSGSNPPKATVTGIQLATNTWSPSKSQTDPQFTSHAHAYLASLQWPAALALALALAGLATGVALPGRPTLRLIVYLVGGYTLALICLAIASPNFAFDTSSQVGLILAWLGCAVLSSEGFARILQHHDYTSLPVGLSPAPIRKRFVAWVIDALIVATIAALMLTTLHPPYPDLTVLLLIGAYWIAQQALRGATLGQHLAGIHTTHATGTKISLPRAALRLAAWPISALFWLGLGSAITLTRTAGTARADTKRTLHDLITNTRIVETTRSSPLPSPGWTVESTATAQRPSQPQGPVA